MDVLMHLCSGFSMVHFTFHSVAQMLLFFACLKSNSPASQQERIQKAKQIPSTAHPTLFDQRQRLQQQDPDLLWRIEGYYGYRGFTLNDYDVYGESDFDFLSQREGSLNCVPPMCTVLYTEPNYPPEMAFWQSLISHFTYFSPTPLNEIQKQGWGTLDHINTSLMKDLESDDTALQAWIEKETLEFYPSSEVGCISHTKIYAESMVDRNNASDSIAEWLIQNGYRDPQAEHFNPKYSSEFSFKQELHGKYQLEMILEDTYSAGGFERLSRIELRCHSQAPIYAKDQSAFELVQDVTQINDRLMWVYQLAHKEH
ncbi:MAG: hypothetical protein CMK59_00305 [Proteobacteria bacterium]|nr:hypothetical protein [Pseudomonadota bacterium]